MSSGRGNRNTKERTKNPGTPAQTKNEGPPNNIKPTPEQVRIAQIIRTDDNQESLMRQLMDMTQKSEEECALALHDCQNDVSRAALLLVEGNGDQGEWKEMGKKKKRQANHTQPPSKSDTAVDHLSEVPDSRRDRSRDMEAGDRPDKSEYHPRRGGRRSNGGPPPRLARGRARERGSFGDNRIEDAEEKENGMGFGSRDRHGERGRGRGRGGQSNRRGRGGARTHRGGQGQRYEKGPHIDTWTNDQADSAENVPGWGETWNEDLGDDSWTGNLNETKVFTASTTKTSEEPAPTTPPGNEAPIPGQRVNVTSLLPKLAGEKQMESFINDYNQQATESIKNSIGIGNDSSRQHYGHQASSVPNLMNSTSQSNSWATASPAAAVGTPTSTAAQACMHRPKPLKSKLPPPSKIPQSAVEMPGHQNVPPIDIHFGLDEGDSVPNYEFTVGGSMGSSRGTSAIYSSASSPSSSSSNHVAPQPPSAKVTAEAPANSTPASMISAPTSQAPPPSLDQPPSRPDFQSSGFPTPKKEGPPTPAPANRMSPPADMTFPPSQQQPEPKPGPGPMMPPPLAAAQPASHSQGSSAPVTESATLVSYAQSTGSYSLSNYKSINSTQAYASTHTTNSQVGSYQNQFQPSPKTYGGSGGSQFQSGASQYPGSQQPSSQYSSSQYPSSAGQNQFQGYQGGSVGSFQGSSTGSSSLYQNPTPASSFQPASASYHSRDSQAGSGPSSTGSGFQGQGAGLSSPTSQAQGSYGGPAFSAASHQPSLPSGGSSLTGNKLSDSLTKMTLKESAMDSHSTSQYDHSTSSTTSTGLTTTSTGALATGTTTVAAAVSTVSPAASSNSSRNSSNLPSAAASKLATMPPGMQMPAAAAAAVGAQYILGNPAFYGVQQPMFGFDEMMLQQRLPLSGNYYDHLPQYPVPTTLPGREVPPLNVPYSASADNSKLTRVDAQSPNPTSQQSHNAPPQQAHYMPNYIYYQHMMPSAAPGFQYQQVYPMPPVTNTAHAGSTATSQFQKNFSHGYSNKGYDDQTQGPDFAKTGYGGSQSQSKGSITSRSGATGDMAATGYGKTHPQQAFDKQGFHGGTPPPFNLPLAAASQATPMAAPNTPYGYMPVMPHQPPQPHSQMTLQHHPMQDSTPGSSRVGGSQGSSMGKAKGYGGYWNN